MSPSLSPPMYKTHLVPRAFCANFLISRMARGARSLKVILCRRLCRLMVHTLCVCVCVPWGTEERSTQQVSFRVGRAEEA